MRKNDMRINHNGIIVPKDALLFNGENRAFRYGDGLFESIRMFEGRLPFWDLHWKRLSKGSDFLKFKNLKEADFYKNEIYKLCGRKGNYRIRLSLFRKVGGLYTPLDMTTDFLIEAIKIDSNQFELNTVGLKVDLCDTITIPRHPLSNFKTINSLPYVLAGIYKNENQVDDCILLNDKKQLVEASSSNIFIIKHKTLSTPKLSSACKDGTMRKVILRLAKNLNFKIFKRKLKPDDLLNAEEIWLSNAIQGIKWVGDYRGHKLEHKWAVEMVSALNKVFLKKLL